MGIRINYQIMSEDRRRPVCILYSNCSHPTMDAEREFKRIFTEVIGPTALVEVMLELRYPSDGGNHRTGERVFTIDTEPFDQEKVYRVYGVTYQGDVNPWRYDVMPRARPVMKVSTHE